MKRRVPPMPDLRYDYSAAVVLAVTIGPRREVLLRLELRLPPDRCRQRPGHRGSGAVVAVRFGAIANFDAVASFFRNLVDTASLGCSLHYLRHAPGSIPGRLVVEMQWDSSEAEVSIRCRHLSVSDPLPPTDEDPFDHPLPAR